MKFKLICVDGTYTGILNGNIFVSENLTSEQVKKLVSNPTEDEVIEIFNPRLTEIKESNKQVEELTDTLLKSGLFEKRGGAYYRVNNPISIPKMLLEKYRNALENDTSQFEALDNFWLKCSLNPNVYARENLFEYLTRWEFVITQKGYVVTYRNANIKQQGNRKLHDFVALNYTRIKGQKRAPKNYWVSQSHKTGDLVLTQVQHTAENDLGNLQELYDNLSITSETVYTDAHSGTTKIRIGEVVSIPLKNCDQSQNECSAGLHTASSKWLKKNYFGSVGLICLVNPMEIVSVPKGDYGKMRSCSYLPIGLTEYDSENNILPVSTDVYEDDYDIHSLEELNARLKEVNPSAQVVHQLIFSEISNQVHNSIEDYRKILATKPNYFYVDYARECYEDEYEYTDEEE